MKTVAVFFFSVMLSACANNPIEHLQFKTVKVTWVRTLPSMPTAGNCLSSSDVDEMGINGAIGCEEMTGIDSCTIWAVEPKDETDTQKMAILGHEILHCFSGDFHQ